MHEALLFDQNQGYSTYLGSVFHDAVLEFLYSASSHTRERLIRRTVPFQLIFGGMTWLMIVGDRGGFWILLEVKDRGFLDCFLLSWCWFGFGEDG